MAKIIVIQPGYAHYRHNLFDLLHRNHNVLFIFLRSKSTYLSKKVPDPNWNTVFLNKENNRFWLLGLSKNIRKQKPQVIITSNNGSYQSIMSVVNGKFLKTPIVLWSEVWASPYRIARPYWKSLIKDLLQKFTVRGANALIVSGIRSKEYNKSIAQRGKPIFISYQCTQDQSLLVEKKISVNLPFSDKRQDQITILYFSRIIRLKGLDILIRAFSELEKQYNNIRLVVAGDGPFYNYCKELAISLGTKNMKFCGAVAHEDAWKFYKQADVFVLPNSGHGGVDGWGLVVNEAASMNLPVITTEAVGAAYDLVRNEFNGYVVKAGDVFALKNAMKKLVEDVQIREKMGKQSRKLYESINDYEKMYDGFERAIECVISKRKIMTC